MTDSEGKYLSWKISATTKDRMDVIRLAMARERRGKKVTQDDVTAALLDAAATIKFQSDSPATNLSDDRLTSIETILTRISRVVEEVAHDVAQNRRTAPGKRGGGTKPRSRAG